jgi:hypothetical protein
VTRPRARLRLLSLLSVLGAVAVTARPRAALAEDQPAASATGEETRSSGLRLALRTGVAVPIGEAFVASGALSSTITGYVPLRLDVGYRIDRHFYVGVAGQLAAVVANACPSDGSCSGTASRFGALIAYHALPSRELDPWIGIGMGFETLSVSRSTSGSKVDIAARGLELLDLELGADLRATRTLRLGPVLSTSLGRYTSVSVNDTATRDFDTSLHAWVMLGFRGAFDL